MLDKGRILDDFGQPVGQYWYREGMNAYTIRWGTHVRNGYTEEGVWKFANSLGYQLLEEDKWEAHKAWLDEQDRELEKSLEWVRR